jgi:hypothetical protein
MNSPTFLRRFLARRLVRRLVQGLAALLVFYAAAGFLLVPWVVKTQLPRRLGPLLHREVSVARVRANPFTLSLTLDGFLVRDRDGSVLLGWDRLYVNLGAMTFLRLAPVIKLISLEGFHAHIVLDRKGNPSFADLLVPGPEAAPAPAKSSPPDLRIGRLQVINARVDFIDQATPQPFATVLGPMTLALDGFRLQRDRRNPYAFSGRTERGETFGWRGHFLLDPFRSAGAFEVGRLYLPKYAPFYRNAVAFDLPSGTLDFRSAYLLEAGGQGLSLKLQDGEADLHDLAVAERSRPGPVVELPELKARGLEADLLGGSAHLASLALRDGKLLVRRDADGTLNLQRLAAAKETEAKVPAKASAKAEAPAKPFRFVLDELRLENQTVRFQDQVPHHPVDLTLDRITAAVKGLSLDPAAACTLDLDLRWNGRGHLHASGEAAPLRSRGGLDLQVEALDLAPLSGYVEEAGGAAILGGRLDVAGRADFDQPGSSYAFKGKASVAAFKAEAGPARAATVAWDNLRLEGVRAATRPMAFTVARIDWDAPTARYILAPAAGAPKAPGAAPGPSASSPGPSASTPGPSGVGPKGEIGAFHLQRGAFTFLDRSIQPVAALSLDAVDVRIGRLTSEPGARASLELSALVDGAAPVKGRGTVNLLSRSAYSDLAFEMGGMDLSPLSPYSGHYVGYGIEKGKLNLDLKYLVEQKHLQSENRIRMDQFTLGEPVESPDALHIPVKLGLALLRDRHGVIDLDVPVDGDLGSPDFHLGKVIWHAIVNVLTKVAASPFTLIGNLFGGGDADLSLLAFAPGSADLDAQGEKVLATLEKGLTERPGLRLEMEGTADEAVDGPALKRAELDAALGRLKGQPVTAEDRPRYLRTAYLQAFPPDKAKPAPEPPAPEMEARLLARIPSDPGALKLLARRRVQVARDHFLRVGQVEEARVFVAEGGERARQGGCKVYFELK